jgi:hypothetical protein
MWQLDAIGSGCWRDDHRTVGVRAAGGGGGIGVGVAPHAGSQLTLEPVAPATLPRAADQFVRGDQWHLRYPEAADCGYSLEMVLRPVESSSRRLVLELTLAIETSRLELHPAIDLRVAGDSLRQVPIAGLAADNESVGSGEAGPDAGRDTESAAASAITQAAGSWGSATVLLGPRDLPFTRDRSSHGDLCLRLFGDFLEKGVIRKARPWVVLEGRDQASSDRELFTLWQQLRRAPLPLVS